MIRLKATQGPVTMCVSPDPIRFSVSEKPASMRVTEEPVSMRVAQKQVSMVAVPAVKVYTGGEPYEGSYIVDPAFETQTLHTKEKVLYNDVTVNAIRVERTSNAHGTTVYIGTKGD